MNIFAVYILMGNEINRVMKIIKPEANEEKAVCLICHRRFDIRKVLRHYKIQMIEIQPSSVRKLLNSHQ